MNYIDLFSGIGGFALGAYWADMKFENHYFSEVEPYAIELYQKRFPDAIPLGDIREIDCEKLADTESKRHEQREDARREREETGQVGPNMGGESRRYSQDWIITGGFPCQDISVAGKGTGIRGERSGLWFEMHRIIRDLRPRFAIMENVGALTFRGLTDVLGSLAEIGYDAEWQDIRAEDVGAPHRRERIWIIAYPSGQRGSGEKLTQQNVEHDICRAAQLCDREGEAKPEMADTGCEHIIWRCGDRGGQACAGSLGRATRCGENDERQWTVEPDVGCMAYGLSGRLVR